MSSIYITVSIKSIYNEHTGSAELTFVVTMNIINGSRAAL